MCPEKHEFVWAHTFGSSKTQGAATDASSASATAVTGAGVPDIGVAGQQLDALQAEQLAADNTRGKLWGGTLPLVNFVTGE